MTIGPPPDEVYAWLRQNNIVYGAPDMDRRLRSEAPQDVKDAYEEYVASVEWTIERYWGGVRAMEIFAEYGL